MAYSVNPPMEKNRHVYFSTACFVTQMEAISTVITFSGSPIFVKVPGKLCVLDSNLSAKNHAMMLSFNSKGSQRLVSKMLAW